MVKLIGTVYRGGGREGDFAWMIQRADYADALFVFNDNEEQFLAHLRDPGNPSACSAGGGNAVIRPWQCKDPPRAAGIPTGSLANGGYRRLSEGARRSIDEALARIRHLVLTHGYRRIYYSAANEGGGLGTGIFEVAEPVKTYIMAGLRELEDTHCTPLC